MIRIYYQKLSSDCSYEQSLVLYRDLIAERKEKIDKLNNKELARKRILTGNFLQQVLSKEMGVPATAIRLTYGPQGKPELDYAAMGVENRLQYIHFNMSHSGDYVVIAVSDHPVGIDIEHKMRNYEAVARRCFCEAEYRDIMGLSAEEQPHRFLEIWTMKEAYIKWKGEGMKIPFRSFDVCRKDSPARVVDAGDTDIPEEYVISVCGTVEGNFSESEMQKWRNANDTIS